MDTQNYTFYKDDLRKLAIELARLAYEDEEDGGQSYIDLLEDEGLGKEALLNIVENLLSTLSLRELNNKLLDIYHNLQDALPAQEDNQQISVIREKLQKNLEAAKVEKTPA